jgi:hypothetical protein
MDILKSDLFTPHTDPESGITSYILRRKVAPVQENFYFVNDPMDASGRYLWFYCAFPPALPRSLGVLDMETGDIRHYPETGFTGASPYVEPETGAAVWAMGPSLWRRGPGANDEVQHLNRLPADLIGDRSITRLATHLTRSADGKAFFVDAAFGLQWVFGTLPVDGGDFALWHRFDRNFNHAQLSPTDPDLVLFAQEHHPDPITGLRIRITDRMWLMRKGEAPRPIFAEPTVVTHEWWDEDGEHVWCIKGGQGTWRVNIHTAEVENLNWPTGAWHSHHHPSGKYVVGDTNQRFYRGTPSTVRFLNRETGRDVQVIDNPARDDYVGANYHIDPHPRFAGGGRYVTFTTTVCGEVDLAVVPVEELVT